MDHIRGLAGLQYKNAQNWLKTLSGIESRTAFIQMDPKIRSFRTNKLKKWKQSRGAALFCEGISRRYNQSIDIAIEEDSDYDCMAKWHNQDVEYFTPIQLKEFVPSNLNQDQNLQDIILSLTKYTDSEDLTVGIYINRKIKIDFKRIKIPRNLKIGELWFFGCASQDKTKWFLYGDFLKKPFLTYYSCPVTK